MPRRKAQIKETKVQRFERLAAARTSACVQRMRILEHCFGPGYEWTGDQAQQVCKALREAVDRIEAKALRDPAAERKPFAWSS